MTKHELRAGALALAMMMGFSAQAEPTNAPNATERREPPQPGAPTRHPAGRAEAALARRYKFIDDMLTELGVDEADRIKVQALQADYRRRMAAAAEAVRIASGHLTQLLDRADATDEALEAAIDAVGEAQKAQLRVLVENRRTMERLLGRETYERILEQARTQYRQISRSPAGDGPPLPPVPPVRRPPPPPEPSRAP